MDNEFKVLDEYFRVVNYLSCAMIYLKDNPLLRKPLEMDDIKKKLVGHWGSAPGQNFVYAHLNRVINKYDLNIHIMDIDYEIMVGDTLYIDGGMIRDERVFTFGKLDSEYGRKIDNNNDKEVVVFKQKDNKYYMKRYYG